MITSLRPLVLRAPRTPRDPSPSRVRRGIREQSSTGARPGVHVTHDNLRALLLFLRSNWQYVGKPVLASAVVPFRVVRGTGAGRGRLFRATTGPSTDLWPKTCRRHLGS